MSADEPEDVILDMDPTNDPPSNDEGQQAPFSPVWEGDPHAGHHRSCGVRVKSACTCGMAEVEAAIEAAKKALKPRTALMPIAGEYLHDILHLPDDVHIVGASWDDLNITLTLEAFSDDEFPGERVTAGFSSKWNVQTGREDITFTGWEAV